MLLAHSSELIGILLAYLLIDDKKVGGRKGFLYFSIAIYMGS